MRQCVCSLGLLWQLRPSDVEVELLGHTRKVVSKDLEEETGLHTGWIQNGGLFIASNKQRLDEYKRLMSVRTEVDGFLSFVKKILFHRYIKELKAYYGTQYLSSARVDFGVIGV